MTGEKAALRQQMRSIRRAFAVNGERVSADHVPGPVRERFGVTASYRPIDGEADPGGVERYASTLLYPRIIDSELIKFLKTAQPSDWENGIMGIAQPRAYCPALVPDVVLVPLVAFDRRGHRLGQGRGYYDRALAALPHALRIGVAWSVQEVDAVPIERWDMPLHAVLTEKEWIAI